MLAHLRKTLSTVQSDFFSSAFCYHDERKNLHIIIANGLSLSRLREWERTNHFPSTTTTHKSVKATITFWPSNLPPPSLSLFFFPHAISTSHHILLQTHQLYYHIASLTRRCKHTHPHTLTHTHPAISSSISPTRTHSYFLIKTHSRKQPHSYSLTLSL